MPSSLGLASRSVTSQRRKSAASVERQFVVFVDRNPLRNRSEQTDLETTITDLFTADRGC